MQRNDESDWVEKLYKPKFDLEIFLQRTLGLDDPKHSDKEIQVDLPRSEDDFTSRTSQTDAQLWAGQDIALLRRAYANKFEELRLKYSGDGSPYDEAVQNLRAEAQEMRENWRSTQQELDACRAELAGERAESARLRIAIAGLRRFSSAQLAEADETRWLARFENASSQQAFRDRLEALQRQQELNLADRARQVEADKQRASQMPSVFDLTAVYRKDEEIKAENRRLKGELLDAVSALQEYEQAYKMLLKHIASNQSSKPLTK